MKKRNVIYAAVASFLVFSFAFFSTSVDAKSVSSRQGNRRDVVAQLKTVVRRLSGENYKNTEAVASETSNEAASATVKDIKTDDNIYHLSQNSKYRPYLWKNADGSAPDYKAYIFEPEKFNGHTVFVDPGHGNNAAPEANSKREKYYPVDDSLLVNMNTSMVGSKAYGVGVEARDSKNVYDNKETEPEFSLRVALILKDLLLKKGYRVVMSRTDYGQNISNGARSALAGETSDIMISIHSNTGNNSGTLTFYPGDKDYISEETYPGYTEIMGLKSENLIASKRLAISMGKNISSLSGLRNAGSHTAVLRIFSYSSIPTCLVEVGFADNINDAKILSTKKAEIAEGMLNAVEEYFAN